MARTSEPHSATASSSSTSRTTTSSTTPRRRPQGWGYTVFGKVVEGMGVVDTIAQVKTGAHGPHRRRPCGRHRDHQGFRRGVAKTGAVRDEEKHEPARAPALLVVAAVLAVAIALLAPAVTLATGAGLDEPILIAQPSAADQPEAPAHHRQSGRPRGHGHRDDPLLAERRQAVGDGVDDQDHDGHPHPGIHAARPRRSRCPQRPSARRAPRWVSIAARPSRWSNSSTRCSSPAPTTRPSRSASPRRAASKPSWRR